MRLDINKRLYDVAIRQNIYVERIKAAQFIEFNKTMNELNVELSRILYRTKYKTLDALTKVELNKLILTLRNSQSKIYNDYTSKIIAQLEAFMKADLIVSQITLSSILAGRELSEDESIKYIEENAQDENSYLFGLLAATTKPDSLWSSIKNQPVPATGNLPTGMILGFASAASASLEMLIRKGYANRYTPEEVIALAFESENIQGTKDLGSVLTNQNKSVIDTTFTDIHALTYGGVASVLFSMYLWHTIMDGRQTEICNSRNLKTYVYGKGPLPPAHYGCRSSIIPLSGAFNGDTLPASLYDWVKSQPDDVISDLFNDIELESLKKTGKFTATQTLNLQQYRDKVSNLLK